MTSAHPQRPARLLIVAAAGYGKSVALDAELPTGGRRLRGSQALTADLSGAPAWGLDDLDELTPQEQVDLVRRLATLPGEVGIVLASRAPLEPAARLRLRGQVLERGPADLLLTQHAVARVLGEEYGLLDPEAAERVHDLTAGWPALVHLAADTLAREPDGDLAGTLTRPGSATATWVSANILSSLPEEVARTLGIVAELGPVTQAVLDRVAEALGVRLTGADEQLLARLGVLVESRLVGHGTRQVVVPAVARVLTAHHPTGEAARNAFRAAASAYEDEGLHFAAACAHARAGDEGAIRRLVEANGEGMLRQGDAKGVVGLLASRTDDQPDVVQRTYADALRLSGDPAAALRAFQPLIEAAAANGWTVELATRVAAVHHTLGDFKAALDALERAGDDAESRELDVEQVEWLSFRVRAMSMLGRRAQAAPLALATMAAGQQLGDPRSLSAAHLAMARVSDGARKEAHHEQARLAAEEMGDAVTTALILVNQSHLELASARFSKAAVSAREVVRISERCCPPGRRVAALHNLAEALTRMGEYDEATWHLQRSIALARRLSPGGTAVGLLGLADIHRQLGHDQRAHSAYLEAVELARVSQESQVLVPALAGLARMQACTAPEVALVTAQEADRLATPSLQPFSLVALGWVALARGDRAEAARLAAESVESARHIQAFDLLAEALELSAECAGDSVEATAALGEARDIWRSGGAAPAAARIEVLLGGIAGADATLRAQGRDAARRLRRLGIGQVNGRAVTSQWNTRTVGIRVLGGFTVDVDGAAVPLTAWRSRQARTLVKILAARRGRPVTRSHVCELLWPDDDPAKTSHRLSVLLTTVRGVLDPEKGWPPEWYIASDQTGIWLDLKHAYVDADDLIRDAEHAATLIAEGADDQAEATLAEVDARYTGDAFEDDPYEEWADGLREEARAAWMTSVRQLVSARNRAGRASESPGLLVRLLAADPYDEQSHRLLVRGLTRARRHGEARRAFERWTAAMRAIDAPPPDPDLLRTAPRQAPRPRGLVVTPR